MSCARRAWRITGAITRIIGPPEIHHVHEERASTRRIVVILLCCHCVFQPKLCGWTYTQNFANGTAPNWSNQISTFSAAAGYYSNDNHDIALAMATYAGDTWDTDYTYSIDMDSEFGGGTANAIGAVYNFLDTNNYYCGTD
jgi:hypothetical protein